VPSVKRAPQLAVLALCGALGAGSIAGCETTQEKAAAQQAESKRILEARAKRQARKSDGPKSQTTDADGTNGQASRVKSAHRHIEGDKTAHGQEGKG
jgi:hypothetical protein